MSLKTTIAEGTLDEYIAKSKARVKASLREAIAVFKQRMLQWVEENSGRRPPVGQIPIATGYLKESAADVIGLSYARGLNFAAYFGFAAEYAKYRDEGRSPGSFPPVDEIEAWCITVGIPSEAAWPIAMKIFQKGIEGQRFFNVGIEYAKMVFREELDRAFAKYAIIATVNLS